jgi:4-diphosphocytidyl-2-C-methyl-D-erythritol kinase
VTVLAARAPAKVNVQLAVGPRRPDGFHELRTVYLAVSLFDTVAVWAGDGLALSVSGEGTKAARGADLVPTDRRNLVWRAAELLAGAAGVAADATIDIAKSIPAAAGLAGGSADAAAALVACDALWGIGLSRDELAVIGADLGSDVPFLLHGGTALGTGHGETVNPVLARPTTWHWVIAIADGGLSTPEVYRELDRLRASAWPPTPLTTADSLMSALRQRDPEVLGAALANDLQPAAISLRPALADVLKAGYDAGAVAGIVSGSGPTCVFLATDASHADAIAAGLEAAGVCREARTTRGPQPGARVA